MSLTDLRVGIDGKSDSDQKEDRLIGCEVESNRFLSLAHGAVVAILSDVSLQKRSCNSLTRAANLLRSRAPAPLIEPLSL